ncbi:MAG: NAD-dependent epimerase/dehydratase family protein [Christensenella sp.]|uniref:NAD-dependent epimerase/dehydratase family protein n=1 Tax=Christensenella sp. TaxID=1935934 RepID=UPI002B1F731C|nr:NAD-dependent epimerase/dehydratase family protein [Christensenella sp.]MEA5003917.1 NAD-dependent epimerase/dehydratase family protein [Christensenella sp.]
MKKNVLVLGGNGFLGQNICEKFLAEGSAVTVFDVAPAHKEDNQIMYFKGCLDDETAVEEAVRGKDIIIHLASATNPQRSMDEPITAYREIEYMQSLCSICSKQGIKRIVFASSGGTVYGDRGTKNKPISETCATYPKNNYAIAKLAMERVLLMYNEVYGMDNIILRISNPYGVGQNPGSRVGAVTVFADHILRGVPLHLFACKHYVRDYVDIHDVVDAFYLAAGWKRQKGILPLFNIGSGKGISMGELVQLICETLNKEAVVNYEEPRLFDVSYNVLNVEKARKYLRYIPKSNELDAIKKYVLSFVSTV